MASSTGGARAPGRLQHSPTCNRLALSVPACCRLIRPPRLLSPSGSRARKRTKKRKRRKRMRKKATTTMTTTITTRRKRGHGPHQSAHSGPHQSARSGRRQTVSPPARQACRHERPLHKAVQIAGPDRAARQPATRPVQGEAHRTEEGGGKEVATEVRNMPRGQPMPRPGRRVRHRRRHLPMEARRQRAKAPALASRRRRHHLLPAAVPRRRARATDSVHNLSRGRLTMDKLRSGSSSRRWTKNWTRRPERTSSGAVCTSKPCCCAGIPTKIARRRRNRPARCSGT
mmetsp:Transcript_73183/g.190615  ORF Transcript_73183/g.190615 Transcript_73183/m.190615 type:complete len:286 (+) Transcript_73183:455-1312(+)